MAIHLESGYREPPKGRSGRLVIAALAVVGLSFLLGKQNSLDLSHLGARSAQLTSWDGREIAPAISGDGRWVVFARELPDAQELWIADLEGNDPPRRLTTGSDDSNPRFSAGEVTFMRTEGGGTLVLTVHPEGGDLREVAAFERPIFGFDRGDDSLIFSMATASGELRLHRFVSPGGVPELLLDADPGLDDSRPRLAPDGESLAFRRSSGNDRHRLMIYSIATAQVRELGEESAELAGFDWLDEGTLIAASRREGRNGLWRIDITQDEWTFTDFTNALFPATAAETSLAAFERRRRDIDLVRVDLDSGVASRWMSTPKDEFDPGVSLDHRIAFVSRRTGSDELWITDSELESMRRISDIGGMPTGRKPRVGHPRWAPDSDWLVATVANEDSSELWRFNTAGQASRLLNEPGGNDRSPVVVEVEAEMRVFFVSDRGGTWQLWSVGTNGAALRQESGQTIEPLIEAGSGGIWRVEKTKGRHLLDPEGVVRAELGSQTLWTAEGDVAVLLDRLPKGTRISVLEGDSRREFEIDRDLAGGSLVTSRGLAIDSLGRLLVPVIALDESDIIVIEGLS